MRYILSEIQFNRLNSNLLSEAPKKIQGCEKFKDKEDNRFFNFCKTTEKIISENLDVYSPKMENLLEKYFSQDNRIRTIEVEKLNEESPIVVEGFKQIDDVVNLISQNCPNGKKAAEKLKKDWLVKYNVYFKDEDGNYHLLNRLNTNYTAMAVLITLYYKPLIQQVRRWMQEKKLPSSDFAKNWIDHFFDPNIPVIDPRVGLKNSAFEESEGELKELYPSYMIFNKVLKPKDFVIEESDYHKEMMDTLEEVRNKGFETEDLFEDFLKEHEIDYIRYSYDYSFVDMVLGVDFLIKEKFQGKTNWVPVQVKTTYKEKYSIIDKFMCDIIQKPEKIRINGKDDFMIGGVRGFNNHFCRNQGYCKVQKSKDQNTPTKRKVYAPASVDYVNSKEFEDSNGI